MNNGLYRKAGYAGSWYPETRKEIEKFMPKTTTKRKIIGAVCPHAGWIYSGYTAGAVYSAMEPAELFVLIGPNHKGIGADISVYPSGRWETPLGDIAVGENFTAELEKSMPAAKLETKTHEFEHSLEVQLPFIKYLSPNAQIVPILAGNYGPTLMKTLGQAIASTLKELKLSSCVIIASSDMSHYISKAAARRLDMMAIGKMLELDPAGLEQTVIENNISMCGYGPAAAMLWAAKNLNAKKSELIEYSSSGEVTGDDAEVVAYAGLIVY